MQLHELIKRQRRKLGMSQRELANKIGFTRGHVSGIETGERNISWHVAVDLLDILQCRVVVVIEGPAGEEEEDKKT